MRRPIVLNWKVLEINISNRQINAGIKLTLLQKNGKGINWVAFKLTYQRIPIDKQSLFPYWKFQGTKLSRKLHFLKPFPQIDLLRPLLALQSSEVVRKQELLLPMYGTTIAGAFDNQSHQTILAFQPNQIYHTLSMGKSIITIGE